MNVLIVDTEGAGLDFAMRCLEAKHEVKMFIRNANDGTRDSTGQGLVERVPEWEKWMQWADVVVPTLNGVYLDRLEDFRKLGYPIFGPSKQSAQLEIQRGYGMQMFKKHGIEVPPYKMFPTLDAAEAYCWKQDRRYVFKTLGTEEDKALTYVATDSADMISAIRNWRRRGKKLKGSCMLQDVIDGIEFGVSRWMGKQGFFGPYGENVEHKKLMSGDYGPNTGETGSLMWYTPKSKLGRQVLDPLEADLLAMGHRGDLDVNCIVDSAGKAWPLEFTARLGWPAFDIMQAQHEEPVQWMSDALAGRDTLKADTNPHIGVLMAIPPFPNKHVIRDAVIGHPIRGITPDNWDSIHLGSVMMGKDVDIMNGKPKDKEMFLTAGEYVAVITGSGDTIRKARRSAYRTVDQIRVKDAMIRDDIGLDFMGKLPELQQHGYATSVEA